MTNQLDMAPFMDLLIGAMKIVGWMVWTLPVPNFKTFTPCRIYTLEIMAHTKYERKWFKGCESLKYLLLS